MLKYFPETKSEAGTNSLQLCASCSLYSFCKDWWKPIDIKSMLHPRWMQVFHCTGFTHISSVLVELWERGKWTSRVWKFCMPWPQTMQRPCCTADPENTLSELCTHWKNCKSFPEHLEFSPSFPESSSYTLCCWDYSRSSQLLLGAHPFLTHSCHFYMNTVTT